MMIHCHTNLDLYNELWPIDLQCVPRIDDEIESMTRRNGRALLLRVVAVRWKMNPDGITHTPHIELHTRHGWSVADFTAWYDEFRK